MSISLRDFGSYTVGGRLDEVTEGRAKRISVTRDVSYVRDPKGHYAVEHGYVQYFVPDNRNAEPPIVLVHGGGMSGSMWERTPDGRSGWLQMLLVYGFEVHVLDNVERGRAGFAAGFWESEPVLRSLEEAWWLFRFGARADFKMRTPFPGQLFPTDCIECFARTFVPRWLTTSQMQIAALSQLLHRLDNPIVICHSQGAEATFSAIELGARVSALIAIEPSTTALNPERLERFPMVLVCGDYLSTDPFWEHQYRAWRVLRERLIDSGCRVQIIAKETGLDKGHSHFPMLDQGNDGCLDLCLNALHRHSWNAHHSAVRLC